MGGVLIWGAGKIGRGFVAEAFQGESSQLTFIDVDTDLVRSLNQQGTYPIIKAVPDREPEVVVISNYTAINVTEKSKINSVIAEVSYIAISVFPEAFSKLVPVLAECLETRASAKKPLDILLCANARGVAESFGSLLREQLSNKGKKYLDEHIGLVETVIMRVAVATPERFQSFGNLAVTTNGFPFMPVNKIAFKGSIPVGSILKPIDNIEAEETRKFFTYNMAHAVYAYSGLMHGFETVTEAAGHAAVAYEVSEALNESAQALIAEYGFSRKEMDDWNKSIVANLTNPLLEDTLIRVGRDPMRKLAHRDRLVGPALLSKKHGLYPYFLTKAIARAFFFQCPGDKSTLDMQAILHREGVSSTLKNAAGLQKDPEIVSMVKRHYHRLQVDPTAEDEPELVALYKKAYSKGFEHERDVHGCAQCTLASMFDVTGKKNDDIYRAASAFAGGVGLSGDGICGGYAAGILWMGTYAGRRLQFMNGDKLEQYKSFEMAQKLRTRFIETYGSVICSDIHKTIFNRAYILLTKAVRDEFEAAGAHTDRCTTVVAIASLWTMEILIEEGLLGLDDVEI